MITGIIFVCLVEQGICQPLYKEFDTVQECIVGTRETINGVEDSSGIVFYALCDPEGEPA